METFLKSFHYIIVQLLHGNGLMNDINNNNSKVNNYHLTESVIDQTKIWTGMKHQYFNILFQNSTVDSRARNNAAGMH